MAHPTDPDRPHRSHSRYVPSPPLGSRDHYDPHQPRVPRGHPDGGQWTSIGSSPAGDPAEFDDRVWPLSDIAELPAPDLRKPEVPRIPPGVYPQYALLDGGLLRSEPSPRSDASPPTRPTARPLARRPAPPPWLRKLRGLPALLGLGVWWLYEQLSSKDDGDGKYVVVGVRARKIGGRDPGSIGLLSDEELTLEQAEEYCRDIRLVQDLVNLARNNVGNPKDFRSDDPGEYGKAVDAEFKRLLREVNADRILKGEPGIFIIDETFSSHGKEAHANEKNAKTPDAYQKLLENACVYLIDTEAGGGDDRDNMLAVAVNMSKHESMRGISTFIMTRVRPSTPPPPPKRRK